MVWDPHPYHKATQTLIMTLITKFTSKATHFGDVERASQFEMALEQDSMCLLKM